MFNLVLPIHYKDGLLYRIGTLPPMLVVTLSAIKCNLPFTM